MVRAGTAVKYGVKSDNFATQVPGEMNANSKLPVVGNTEGYGNQRVRINGETVTLKGFKGASDMALARFNNFLSDTVDTTMGKGVRNAMKPSNVSIDDDWKHLTQDAVIKEYPNGRKIAIFKDGEKAIYRPSSTGPMTIELQRPDNKKIIEVRYGK